MKVALVTDSNAQMPRELLDRFRVSVVPLTIVLDGEEFREGVDLTTNEFYERLANGAVVSTAAPSPGDVLDVYQRCAAAGADAVLSVHVGSNTSATMNSVALAATMSPIPVATVDTGTASFAVGCCVWEAAERLARGASLDEARAGAEAVGARVGNVFVVGALGLARAGGRLASDVADVTTAAQSEAPVLALENGKMRAVDRVADFDRAIEAMHAYFEAERAGPQRIGIGDAQVPALADQLAERIGSGSGADQHDIIRYEVGPSVGAHTGAGTVGMVFFRKD